MRRPRDPRPVLEDSIQQAICDLLKLTAHPRLLWHSVPNGLPSSPRAVARFLKTGLRPGVGDLSLTLPSGRSAYLEVKRPDGRLSPEQQTFAADCIRLGIPYAVVRSVDEAEAVLRGWNALKERRAA